MQPLVLSIPGDFWDVQIYRGRLYLWHYDGRLSVYDWERLIELAYPKASPVACSQGGLVARKLSVPS